MFYRIFQISFNRTKVLQISKLNVKKMILCQHLDIKTNFHSFVGLKITTCKR